jgi:glycosyltransferase involved in cell wall biosynthesis
LVRFVFVGAEEKVGEMKQLMEFVRREKLAPWVVFAGGVEREKVPIYLGLANVFLLPSFDEGMPVAIIEAMRGGVPVISTRVAAIPDMIEDGASGLLINPGAPEEIAEAVLRIRRDPSLRARLAEGGKKVFDEKFEFSRGIEEIRNLYRSI